MKIRRWMLRLFSGALLLPIVICVLLLFWQLLQLLGDRAGSELLRGTTLCFLVAWVVDLVVLLLLSVWLQIRPKRPQ